MSGSRKAERMLGTHPTFEEVSNSSQEVDEALASQWRIVTTFQ